VLKASQNGDPTSSYNFNTLFDFSEDVEHGFAVFGKDSSIDKKDDSALSVRFKNSDLSSVGYAFCENVKKSKISNDSLLISLSLGGGGTDSYTVTLTIIQKNAKKGDTVYESSVSGLSGASSLLLDFDVSEFRRELTSGDLELRISAYSESIDDPSCELRVTKILIGKEKSNTLLIVLLTVLAVTAVVVIIILSVVWFKRNYTIERTTKTKEKEKKEEKTAKKQKSPKNKG